MDKALLCKPYYGEQLMTKKYGPCTNQELIKWLHKHLDDCPTEWELDENYGMDCRTAIVFETEEN